MTSYVFDLDGVLWRGDTKIDGGVRAAATLVDAGEQVLFVTNFSYAPIEEVEAKLARFGVDGRGRVITSSLAAASLVEPGEAVLLCGGPGLRRALESRGARIVGEPARASSVVVGYQPGLDYRELSRVCRAIWSGARFIATNEDGTYPAPDGLLPGTGATVAAITAATGAVPAIAGKPHEPMAALVWARLGRGEGVFFGDRADTDGAMAQRLGFRFAFVRSGVTSADPPSADVAGDDAWAALLACGWHAV